MAVGIRGGLARAAVAMLLVSLTFVPLACGGDEGDGGAGGSAGERAFLSAMVPHHESALEMAAKAKSRAAHPRIRALSREIITAQRLEIRRMKDMHERLFGEPLVPDDDAHSKLGLSAIDAGMAHGDMAALDDARPFDRAFIDAMIGHHAGAIRMAHAVMVDGADDEILDLADGIVRAQSHEIRELNRWRLEWYGSRSPAGGVPQATESGGSIGAHEGH